MSAAKKPNVSAPRPAKATPARQPRPRVGILVCGMHRSGTSAATRVLNLLGAALPKDVYPAGPGNELGHWEPQDSGVLHDAMFASMGTHWASLVPGSDGWAESQAVDRYRDGIRNLLIDQYGDEPLFIVKDPRISIFLPLWLEVMAELGIQPRIILATRNPAEVAQSLNRRHAAVDPDWVWHRDRGGMLWLKYMLAAEKSSRGYPRAFCDYSDWLMDWRGTASRIAEQLGIVWPTWSGATENQIDGFLSPDMRHHDNSAPLSSLGPPWKNWIGPVYQDFLNARLSGQVDVEKLNHVEAELSLTLRHFGAYLAAIEAGQAAASQSNLSALEEREGAEACNVENSVHAAPQTLIAEYEEKLQVQRENEAAAVHAASQQLSAEYEEKLRLLREHEANTLHLASQRLITEFEAKLASERVDFNERLAQSAADHDLIEKRAEALALHLLRLEQEKAGLSLRVQKFQDLETSLNRQIQENVEYASTQKSLVTARLTGELDVAKAHTAALARLASEMGYSFSWRVTRPIRMARSRFPRLADFTYGIFRRIFRKLK